MKRFIWSSVLTMAAAVALAGSANAVSSLAQSKPAIVGTELPATAEAIAYRKKHYRGSQWNGSRRFHHGRSATRGYGTRYYGYSSSPGIYLNFGGSRRYGHRNRGYGHYGNSNRRYR